MKKTNILVSVKKLNTKFKNGKEIKIVHKDLSLDIFEGEVLSIIGPNGSGKTVLVETIAQLRDIQDGEIKPKKGFNLALESGIQLQTEDNISDNIKPINLIKFYSKFFKSKISKEELQEMIEIFGLTEFMNRKLSTLSGGQRQRLNLLLAVLNKPRLLILDEFTTGLDITTVIDILKWIMKFVKDNKSTLVIVTHSAKEIKMLADRVVLLKDGVIKEENLVKDVDKKYKGDFDQFLIDQIGGVK